MKYTKTEFEGDIINSDIINSAPTSNIEKSVYTEKLSSLEVPTKNKRFIEQEKILKDLLSTSINSQQKNFIEVDERKELIYSDTTIIREWKNVENISSRLIENYDNIVVLECLIDKELGIYEEREFLKSLFTGYNLKIGNCFLVRIFERQNEIKIQIHDDPKLTLEKDFPKINFYEKFKMNKLFRNK